VSTELPATFRARVAEADRRMSAVDEARSRDPYRPGGWTRKEIVGHLVDSALNNHQRFVRASLDGTYQGPGYQQREWVSIHGYDELSWNDLLAHWRLQNALLARVVERIPAERYDAGCTVGQNSPMTLEALIVDYLDHMEHHVKQVEG
jgi:hypothetical protein